MAEELILLGLDVNILAEEYGHVKNLLFFSFIFTSFEIVSHKWFHNSFIMVS